ncbi:hypothetical protein R0J87_10920 [Halomonas sp. SIMBA_159]
MSNVTPFVPKKNLAAKSALSEFVGWAKSQIHLYDRPLDPVQWSAESWFRWGLKNSVFFKYGSKSEVLHSDFIDYAKAIVFYERAVKLIIDNYLLNALRCLEVALLEVTKQGSITAVTAAVFDRACIVAQDYYSTSSAYRISRKLKYIVDHIHMSGVVVKPFIWEPQLKIPRETLKKSEEDARKKMPSEESLIALGEIFSNKPELPLDILTTSAVAIMLSQPSRVGELIYIKKDCFFTESDEKGNEQLYMLWHSLKGFGANKKVIPDAMAGICKEAVSRIIEVTQDSREYAKWLEDNPDLFPPHSAVPEKDLDATLTLNEVCDALMLSTENYTPRSAFNVFLKKIIKKKMSSVNARNIAKKILDGYDTSKGTRCYVSGRLAGFDFNDNFSVTLRLLNVLVREKYLPRHFPYTDDKQNVKWKDALFCFKTGSLFAADGYKGQQKPFGLTSCEGSRLGLQLTGSHKQTKSIFERHGYSNLRVNSHAFRHFLNTGAQRSGMSQEMIARWSGRVDVNENRVYNHMSTEEKVAELEAFIPQLPAMSDNLLASLKTNDTIRLRDLGDESDRIVHRTEFGICIHDYAQEPCAKFNNCLTCGEHVCVKGDETKLANLKEEREYLRSSLETFQREADEGAYGANTWLQTTMEKMERCDQLIQMLENPDIEDGALIKGIENGWTAGRNALAMRGELVEEDTNYIATDLREEKVAELERLLDFGG